MNPRQKSILAIALLLFAVSLFCLPTVTHYPNSAYDTTRTIFTLDHNDSVKWSEVLVWWLGLCVVTPVLLLLIREPRP